MDNEKDMKLYELLNEYTLDEDGITILLESNIDKPASVYSQETTRARTAIEQTKAILGSIDESSSKKFKKRFNKLITKLNSVSTEAHPNIGKLRNAVDAIVGASADAKNLQRKAT